MGFFTVNHLPPGQAPQRPKCLLDKTNCSLQVLADPSHL